MLAMMCWHAPLSAQAQFGVTGASPDEPVSAPTAPGQAGQVSPHAEEPTVSVATDVPLPAGVSVPLERSQVRLGSHTLDVSRFETNLDEDALIRFYETELPHLGWRLELLPWQAQHLALTQRLAQALKDHPDWPEAPAMRTMLSGNQATIRQMRSQMYARRGEEHVIVNLLHEGSGIAVYLNRWRGEAFWESPQRSANGTARSLPTNVVCSKDAVPGTGDLLPFEVPRYPGARLVAQSTSPIGENATSFLMTTDRLEPVMNYYRRHMPSHGWRMVSDESQVLMAGKGAARIFTYEKPNHVCVVTLQSLARRGGWLAGVEQTTMTIAVLSLPMDPSTRATASPARHSREPGWAPARLEQEPGRAGRWLTPRPASNRSRGGQDSASQAEAMGLHQWGKRP
jgi:hypothetical protein